MLKTGGVFAALMTGVLGGAPNAVAQTAGEAFLGQWSCVTVAEKTTTVQTIAYLPDGRLTILSSRSGTYMGAGMLLQVSLTSEGTWEVTPEGKLIEQPTTVTVTDAKMAGGFGGPQPVDKRPIQKALNDTIADQRAVSTFTFSENAFKSTDEKGAISDCKREASQ